MKSLLIVSLIAATLTHCAGKTNHLNSIHLILQQGEFAELADTEGPLEGYGYFLAPQLLYNSNAAKRTLQKKSKEKHRMLFTRMGRASQFYPARGDTVNFSQDY